MLSIYSSGGRRGVAEEAGVSMRKIGRVHVCVFVCLYPKCCAGRLH